MPSPGHHFENISVSGKGHLDDIYNICEPSLLIIVYLCRINANNPYRCDRDNSISCF
jgi:hypothetical protein